MRETGPDSGRQADQGKGGTLLKRIGSFLSRYNTGVKVGVAVSGGSDSLALLHLLHDLAEARGLELTVLHFNHGLRGAESDGDEAFVSSKAEALGLQIVCGRAAVAPDSNVEAWARRARMEFFGEAKAGLGLDCVATGHTRDDQAETVLMRILRGTGGAGLAGVLPVTKEGLVRPLLGCTREELREYLRELNLVWREDRTNSEVGFADRNRVRLELLPLLRAEWNPQVDKALAQLAEVAVGEEAYWEAEVDRLLPLLSPFGVIFEGEEVRGMPLALRRRLMRGAVKRVKGDLRQIEFQHIEQMLGLFERKRGDGRVELAGGVVAERSFGQIRVAMDAPFENGEVRWRILEDGAARILRTRGAYNGVGYYLDAGKVSLPLVIREWKSGDVFHAAGVEGPKSLKELFQRAKVPCWERAGWPMVVSSGTVVWTRGFGVAAGYEARESNRHAVDIVVQIEDFGKQTRKLESNRPLTASIHVD